jgi:hypothetical protein
MSVPKWLLSENRAIFERKIGVMRWKNCQLISILFLLLAYPFWVSAASQPPPEGGVLPNIELPVPEKPYYRQYLGLDQKSVFSIPEIKAEVVIIEIFSMY